MTFLIALVCIVLLIALWEIALGVLVIGAGIAIVGALLIGGLALIAANWQAILGALEALAFLAVLIGVALALSYPYAKYLAPRIDAFHERQAARDALRAARKAARNPAKEPAE